MRSIIIINGYPTAEKFYKQGERIANALRKRGVQADVVKNGDVCTVLQADGSVKAVLPHDYDFAVYLDKDKYLSQILEKNGFRFIIQRALQTDICL